MYDAMHHELPRNRVMRTTLAIDDDVLAAAKHLAEMERKSLGEVISTLARQGLTKTVPQSRAVRNGMPLLPTRNGGVLVTLDLVNRLRDEQP
jgi:hypothetical protein